MAAKFGEPAATSPLRFSVSPSSPRTHKQLSTAGATHNTAIMSKVALKASLLPKRSQPNLFATKWSGWVPGRRHEEGKQLPPKHSTCKKANILRESQERWSCRAEFIRNGGENE